MKANKHTWIALATALLTAAPLLCRAGTEVADAPAQPVKPAADKTADASAPAPVPNPEAGTGFDIPIPLGQTSQGVVVQNINPRGDEMGVMKANEATRISEDEVELGDLRLKLLGTKKQPLEMNITIDKAVFNVKTSILKSRSRVHIQRQDFDLYGDAMEFNTITGAGQLFGEVNMIIHDASKLSPPPKPTGPNGDMSDAGPAAQPGLAVP